MPLPSRSKNARGPRGGAWALTCLAWLLILAAVPTVEAQGTKKAAPAKADAPASTTGATDAPARGESMLVFLIKASGVVGLVIVCLSVYFVAMVIRLFLEFRLGEAVPPALVDRLEQAIKERKFQEAYDACRDDNSFLARLVRTGVANLPNGRPEAKEAMDAAAEEAVINMETKISYLATIGTLGPMLGLLGTVWGMILAFQNIAQSVGGQVQPDKLAGNIGTALVTTLEGIILAIPAIFFFAFFRNRITLLTVETTRVADRTIAAFYSAAKQPTKAPA